MKLTKVAGIEPEAVVARLRASDPKGFRYILIDRAGKIVDQNAFGQATRWAFYQEQRAAINALRSTAAIRETFVACEHGVYAVEG